MTAKKRVGRPITGWRRGREIKLPTDVQVGDVLIYDSRQFSATNLIRVKKLRVLQPGDPVTGFYWKYVSPDLTFEEPAPIDCALAWYWEIARGGFYKAVRNRRLNAEERRDRLALAESGRSGSTTTSGSTG